MSGALANATVHRAGGREAAVRALLDEVMDPEIPVLSVNDLGIIRAISFDADRVTVDVAPTYSGCPAMEVIEGAVARRLRQNGYPDVVVNRVLAPAWTTDWISERGRARLHRYGIAPPPAGSKASLAGRVQRTACPRCDSTDTRRSSEFGSTPCKAAWQCNACLEPFEQFKCI